MECRQKLPSGCLMCSGRETLMMMMIMVMALGKICKCLERNKHICLCHCCWAQTKFSFNGMQPMSVVGKLLLCLFLKLFACRRVGRCCRCYDCRSSPSWDCVSCLDLDQSASSTSPSRLSLYFESEVCITQSSNHKHNKWT